MQKVDPVPPGIDLQPGSGSGRPIHHRPPVSLVTGRLVIRLWCPATPHGPGPTPQVPLNSNPKAKVKHRFPMGDPCWEGLANPGMPARFPRLLWRVVRRTGIHLWAWAYRACRNAAFYATPPTSHQQAAGIPMGRNASYVTWNFDNLSQ